MITEEIRDLIDQGFEPRVRFRKKNIVFEGNACEILKSRKKRLYVALRTDVPDASKDQMHPMRVHLKDTREWELLT